MTIIEINCRRVGTNLREPAHFSIWFWRVTHGKRQDSYRSIVMTTEPPEPRPGDYGPFRGKINPKLGLGGP